MSEVTCPRCKGSRVVEHSYPMMHIKGSCPDCGGTGIIAEVGETPIPRGLLADDLVGNVRRRLDDDYGREEYRILTMLEDLRALCDAVEYLLAERDKSG